MFASVTMRRVRAACFPIVAALVSAGILGVVAPAAAAAAASSTCTTAGTGVVADFCFQPQQPTGTAAGSDAPLLTTIKFLYPSNDAKDTVTNLTVTLAPGLLAIPTAPGATCTSYELTAGTCPAASEVGSGTVVAGLPGIQSFGLTAYSALYAMAVPQADAGTDVAYFGLAIWLGPNGPTSGNPPALTANAAGSIATTAGGQPAVQFTFENLPTKLPPIGKLSIPIQVQKLTLLIDGTVPGSGGGPVAYTRLPTNCSLATTTLTVDTVTSGSTTDGGGSDSFTPTGCSSLPFSPALNATAARDGGDLGVSFVSTVTQPAGQAANSSIELAVPSATLGPNLLAAVGEFGDAVGSAEAVTPLLSAPLDGTVTLTGSIASPTLTIAFPPPVPLTLTGSVDIADNTVTFANLPDVPLSSLTVTLDGGSGALYASVCNPTYGVVDGTFTGQNGTSASDNAPFTVSNCPAATPATSATTTATTTTTPAPVVSPPVVVSAKRRPPTLSHASLTGASGGAAKLRFTLTAGTSKLSAFTVSPPPGLRIATKTVGHGVSVSGARIRSLRVRGGRLVVDLRAGTSKLAVTLSARALDVQPALRVKARRRTRTTLTGTVAAGTVDGTTTQLKLRVRV